jgi:hypothetical protein
MENRRSGVPYHEVPDLIAGLITFFEKRLPGYQTHRAVVKMEAFIGGPIGCL